MLLFVLNNHLQSVVRACGRSPATSLWFSKNTWYFMELIWSITHKWKKIINVDTKCFEIILSTLAYRFSRRYVTVGGWNFAKKENLNTCVQIYICIKMLNITLFWIFKRKYNYIIDKLKWFTIELYLFNFIAFKFKNLMFNFWYLYLQIYQLDPRLICLAKQTLP